MGGGLGRAQGGYDEMVFRAMVRDDAHFYDPLGLVSRGVQIDFQVGVNAYLYGTRFFTWLAYAYSPEKVIDWMRRDEGDKRYYADQFRQVFGIPLDEAWQRWIAFEHDVPAEKPGAKYAASDHAVSQARRHARWARSRASTTTRRAGCSTAAFRYPGFVEHVGALNTRDGTDTPLADIKGAMLYRVASFAYDPATRHGVLHQRQSRATRPDGGRRSYRRGAYADRGRAHRRHRRSIPSTSR